MMKNYFLLMVMGAMLLYSCSDEAQEAITNPATLLPSMTATVDGASWSSDKPAGIFLADSNRLTITGLNEADTSSIIFTIKAPDTKAYDLADSTNGTTAVYDIINVASSGNVTITSYTAGKIVSGSFSFETDSTFFTKKHSITAGTFKNVPVVTQ